MEDYLKQFVHKFKEEAFSLLSQLEEELLELEADNATQGHLETIFRVMHTLKGTAGMYGFEHIQNLTHHLETVYDLVREGSFIINNETLELTLISVDHIKNLLEDENLENEENANKQERLLEHVLNIVSTPQQNENSLADTNTNGDQEPSQMSTYYIMLRVDQALLDRGISLINVFRDLAEFGKYSIVKSLESYGFSNEVWGIYYATKHGNNVLQEVFMFLEDHLEWRLISHFDLFDRQEFNAAINKLEVSGNHNESARIQRSILDMVEEKYHDAKPERQGELKQEESESGKIDSPKKSQVDTQKEQKENIAQKVDRVVERHRNIETSRISVSAEKLDMLMHLVTELVTTQSQFSLAIKKQDMRSLRDIYERTQKLTKQFRDNTLDIRLVPLADILIRFKRLVRDLAKQLGKKVNLITEGMETELDKNMIDSLAEPLLHLVRNCLDHGIETPEERIKAGKPEEGTIEIVAFHSGGHVFIIVRDDGAGINRKRIQEKAIQKKIITSDNTLTDHEVYDLIFRPGFSTAQVVSEVSGRGVGMDIVRQKINEIRGEVEINSEEGKHTTFTVKLQPTIAIIDTMLVQIESTFCLIPISDIEVCDQISIEKLEQNKNLQTLPFNNQPTPFIDLRKKLGLSNLLKGNKSKLLFINLQGRRFAILVDKIIGEHQAVLKPLSEEFHSQKLIASASTLGDGSLAFMLDMNNLFAEVEEKAKRKTK